MPAPTVIPPGGGELVGNKPDRRVEILTDHAALHATVSRFGPRREGADLHVHRRHTDLFYVIEGELTVRLGPEDRQVAVPAGTLARVPPLVVHGFRNGDDADVRYLNFHAPGQGFADYLRALRDGRTLVYDQEEPPADGGRPPAEAVVGAEERLPDAPAAGAALLADMEALGVAEVRIAPGAPAPPHRHRRHVESLFVLAGDVELACDGQTLPVPAGSWVDVPAGAAHALAAPGPEPAHVLCLHAPSCGLGPFVRALRAAGGDEARAAATTGFDLEPAE
jgi:mannose-6-phosphate isomerase-like protein (cupin superfamily)